MYIYSRKKQVGSIASPKNRMYRCMPVYVCVNFILPPGNVIFVLRRLRPIGRPEYLHISMLSHTAMYMCIYICLLSHTPDFSIKSAEALRCIFEGFLNPLDGKPEATVKISQFLLSYIYKEEAD